MIIALLLAGALLLATAAPALAHRVLGTPSGALNTPRMGLDRAATHGAPVTADVDGDGILDYAVGPNVKGPP